MAAEPGPFWDVPGPIGYPDAIAGMGTVAAPLLAGFALTLLGIVLTSAASVRWPGAAGLVLTISTVSLLAAVQFTFWARMYAVAPSQFVDWWNDASTPARLAMLRDEQWSYRATHDLWAMRASRAYVLGVIALLVGVAVVLVPHSGIGAARILAIAVVALAVVLETAWVFAPHRLVGTRFATWTGAIVPITPPPTADLAE